MGRTGADGVIVVLNSGTLPHFTILESQDVGASLLQFPHAQRIQGGHQCLAFELLRGCPLDTQKAKIKKDPESFVGLFPRLEEGQADLFKGKEKRGCGGLLGRQADDAPNIKKQPDRKNPKKNMGH